MHIRKLIILLLFGILLLAEGCARAPATPTPTISGLVIILPSSTPTSAPSTTPTSTATIQSGYPLPIQATQVPPTAPGVVDPTAYPVPYQPPGTTPLAPSPTLAASPTLNLQPTTPSAYPVVENTPTVVSTIGATLTPPPTITGTPPAIPLDIPPVPAVTPPVQGSLVRIWVAWNYDQLRALDRVIDTFQDVYPGIRFQVINFPPADLRRAYEVAVYNGDGPSLLIAPAEWGPQYYESGLITNLYPNASPEFLAHINPAALGTGLYRGALISLPVSQQGVVLYRNRALIPEASESFEDLIVAARAATRAGNLGAYFDRGAFFSAASLVGLGGTLMNPDLSPAFNGPAGLAWLDLMAAYDTAGAIGMNTNRDLDLFAAGRIGYIIEGTWQIDALAQALGDENLAIDPWPEYTSGRLSGFVQTEAVYFNPNTRPGDTYSAMLFMGYLLTPDVQEYLAESGMIPVILDANPRPVLIAQAAHALQGGTAYPPVVDPHVITAYWEGLELAIQAVFSRGVEPLDALLSAQNLILQRLSDLNP